jgi:hypothetical protein
MGRKMGLLCCTGGDAVARGGRPTDRRPVGEVSTESEGGAS